jgi:predicted transcriptional regulator
VARWRGAVDELYELGLLEDRGGKGEVFFVTNEGYEFAERLTEIG